MPDVVFRGGSCLMPRYGIPSTNLTEDNHSLGPPRRDIGVRSKKIGREGERILSCDPVLAVRKVDGFRHSEWRQRQPGGRMI